MVVSFVFLELEAFINQEVGLYAYTNGLSAIESKIFDPVMVLRIYIVLAHFLKIIE
jgi:hypothetical protein